MGGARPKVRKILATSALPCWGRVPPDYRDHREATERVRVQPLLPLAGLTAGPYGELLLGIKISFLPSKGSGAGRRGCRILTHRNAPILQVSWLPTPSPHPLLVCLLFTRPTSSLFFLLQLKAPPSSHLSGCYLLPITPECKAGLYTSAWSRESGLGVGGLGPHRW